jgi:hypothetical protein
MTDFDPAALGAEFTAAIRGESGSTDAPSGEATSETAAPATPAEGSTPDAAAAPPDQATPGAATPAAQPTPASDVPGRSDYQTVLARYGGDPERLAREFFALEQRQIATVKALKERDAEHPPTEPQPAAVGAKPPQAAKPTGETSPQEPEHPAQGDDISTQIEQQVRQDIAQDSECVRLKATYDANKTRLQELITLDQAGYAIGGELVALGQEINILKANLDPEMRKKLGLPDLDLDEYGTSELQRKLERLEGRQHRLESEHSNLQQRNERLNGIFERRVGQFKQHYQSQYDAQRREAEQDAVAEQDGNAFAKEWGSHETALFTELNVPEEDRQEIHDVALAHAKAAHADGRLIMGDPLRPFLEKVIKGELARAERFHRRQMGEYGKLKTAQSAQPAPKTPAAAIAPPLPADDPDLDWQEKLVEAVRAERATWSPH